MAIAQKFEFLDQQTNAPLIDLSQVTGKEIFNTIENKLKDIPSAIADLEKSIKDKFDASGIKDTIASMKDKINQSMAPIKSLANTLDAGLTALDSVVKSVTNSINQVMSILDPGKLLGKIESMLSTILPAGVGTGFLKSIATACKLDLGSYGQIGGLFGLKGSGSSNSCGATAVTSILDALSGSKTVSNSINDTISAVVNVSSMAYKNKINGAFNTITSNLSNLNIEHKARAAAGVVTDTVHRGDIEGFADMAKHSVGFNVPSIVPQAGNTLLTNAKIGDERSVLKQSELALASLEAYGVFDLDKPNDDKYNLTDISLHSEAANKLFKVSTFTGNSLDVNSNNNSNPLAEIAYSLSSVKDTFKNSFSF